LSNKSVHKVPSVHPSKPGFAIFKKRASAAAELKAPIAVHLTGTKRYGGRPGTTISSSRPITRPTAYQQYLIEYPDSYNSGTRVVTDGFIIGGRHTITTAFQATLTFAPNGCGSGSVKPDQMSSKTRNLMFDVSDDVQPEKQPGIR
jgi:hypothetical protein